MKHLLLVAVLAASGACSKHSPAGESGSAAACADGAAKAVSALPGGLTGPAAEVPAKLRAILTARCTEDRWPASTIDCYATKVHDMAGMKACRELLPADQQQKLMTEIRTVMMGAAAGGMPPHGMGGPMAAPVAPVSQAPAAIAPAPAAPAP